MKPWRPKNWKEKVGLIYFEAHPLARSEGANRLIGATADAMQKAMLKHFRDNMKVGMIDFPYGHGDVERFKKEVESLFTEL